MKCFNGHEVEWGVPKCPQCGATTYTEFSDDESTTKPTTESTNKIGQLETPQTTIITLQRNNDILIKFLKKWLPTPKINTKEERADCSAMLTNARQAKSIAKEKYDVLTERPRAEIAEVDKDYKPYKKLLEDGIESLTSLMSKWCFEHKSRKLPKELCGGFVTKKDTKRRLCPLCWAKIKKEITGG